MLVARCFNIAHSEETNSVHYNTGHYKKLHEIRMLGTLYIRW